MTSEENNKIYGNKVMNFIDAFEKDGYEMANYSKVRELTEIIAKGGEEPLKNYQSLKNLQERIGNEEDLTNKFRFGIRDSLNKIFHLVSRDPKMFDPLQARGEKKIKGERQEPIKEYEEMKRMISGVKMKLGVLQADDRVAEVEAKKASIKSEIDSLDFDTTMSKEEKNKKARELLLMYNGAINDTIENAKYVASLQKDNLTRKNSLEFAEEVNQDLKKIYDHLMTINLLPEIKKALIDEFNVIAVIRNEYKASLSKYNSNLKLYQNAVAALGLRKIETIKTKKIESENKKEENKKEIPAQNEPETEPVVKINEFVVFKGTRAIGAFVRPDTSNDLKIGETYKIEELVIKNGLTYYVLAGKGDTLYDASVFEGRKFSSKEELEKFKETFNVNQTTEKSETHTADLPEIKSETSNGKKVTDQKPVYLGKGSIALKLAAATYLTAAVIVPAVGVAGMIPALLYAHKKYKNYAKFRKEHNLLTPMQRVFPFLIKKVKEKAEKATTTPEEKMDLNNIADAIDQEVEKTPEQTLTGNTEMDTILEQAKSEMVEEGLSKEEAIEQAFEDLTNTPAESAPQMGGR